MGLRDETETDDGTIVEIGGIRQESLDKVNQRYKDPYIESIGTILARHKMIHLGNGFMESDAFGPISSSGGVKEFMMTFNESELNAVHLTIYKMSVDTAPGSIKLLRNPTYDTLGSSKDPVNLNELSDKTSEVNFYVDPTNVSSFEKELSDDEVVGSKQEGGSLKRESN